MSKSRALGIAANASSVQVCRDLALLHEDYMRVLASEKKKSKCSSCDTAGPAFNEIRNRAFQTIIDLSDTDFILLKAFLRETTISFYIGESPNIKRITR
jgi:hypothetical protein